MPATVVKTGRDETLWSKAKRLASEQYPKVAEGSPRYYRLVMGIYNKMKGGTVIKKAFGRTGGQRAGHKYVRRVALGGGGYRYIYPGDEPKGRGAKKPEDEGEGRRPGAEEEPPKAKKHFHAEFAGLAANAVGKGDGKIPQAEATKKLTSAFNVYAKKFDGAMKELKGKGFNDFVGPETKKVADDLILKGEATGYNIDHLGIAKRDYTNLLRAGNCIFYHQYVQNADHGRELLARMTTAGLICPYKVSRMASTVLWDDEWGKDAEVEYEEVGGKKLGRSFQYSLVFQPRSAEEADAVADFIGHHAKAGGAKQPIEHSWFVPDVRSTFKEKVDEYEQRYLNTREVGDDEILVLKKEQMKGFKAEPIWLNPGLAKFVKAYTLTTLTKGHRRAHTRRLRGGRAVRVRATTIRDKRRRATKFAFGGNVTDGILVLSEKRPVPALKYIDPETGTIEIFAAKATHGEAHEELVDKYEYKSRVKKYIFQEDIVSGFIYKRKFLTRSETYAAVGIQLSAEIKKSNWLPAYLELKKSRVKGHTRRTKKKVTRVRAHERKDKPKKPEPPRKGRQVKMFKPTSGADAKHEVLSNEALELADAVAQRLKAHDPRPREKYYHSENMFEKPHLTIVSTPAGYVVGLADGGRTERKATPEEQVRGRRVVFDYELNYTAEPIILPSAHAVLAFLDTAGFDLYKLQPKLTARDMKAIEAGSDVHTLYTRPRFPKDKGLRFIFSAEFGKMPMPTGDEVARKLRSGISDLRDVVKVLAALGHKEIKGTKEEHAETYRAFETFGLNVEVAPSQVTRGKIRPQLLRTMGETLKGIELFNRIIPLAEKAKKFGLKFKYRSVGRGTRGFAALYDPQDRAIVISSTALNTLAHELGHFLSDYFDHSGATITTGKYEGEFVRDAFDDFKSELLIRARACGGVPVKEISRVERGLAKKQKRFARDIWKLYYYHKHGLDYMLRPEEVWARFLAQHIAVKLKRKGASAADVAFVSDYDERTLYGKVRSVSGKRIISRNYMFPQKVYQAAARDFEKWFAGTPVEGLLKALGLWTK